MTNRFDDTTPEEDASNERNHAAVQAAIAGTTQALQGHSPGPWTYQATAGDHDFSIYPEATGRDVALVRDFNEANARLIAAAPAMLEALRELIEQLEGIGIPDWHGAEGLDLQQARAAIAQATG